MADTSIEWTDATWNPVAGCTVLTAGCTNCYAMRMAARLDAMGAEKYKGLTRKSGGRAVWTGKIRLDEKSLDAPRSMVEAAQGLCEFYVRPVSRRCASRVYPSCLEGDARHAAPLSDFDKAPGSGWRGSCPSRALRTSGECVAWHKRRKMAAFSIAGGDQSRAGSSAVCIAGRATHWICCRGRPRGIRG